MLIGPGMPSAEHGFLIFDAVDHRGVRYRPGDHVSVYSSEDKEWVCILDVLYQSRDRNEPTFCGRWFWWVADVEKVEGSLCKRMRPSKCKSHELIASTSRGTNPVKSISDKCTILSYANFQLVEAIVTDSDYQGENIFFCERQYDHHAHCFSQLNNLLFPGDPIPPSLRSAAGFSDEPPYFPEHDSDSSDAYVEPPYAAAITTSRSERNTKSPDVSSDHKRFW